MIPGRILLDSNSFKSAFYFFDDNDTGAGDEQITFSRFKGKPAFFGVFLKSRGKRHVAILHGSEKIAHFQLLSLKFMDFLKAIIKCYVFVPGTASGMDPGIKKLLAFKNKKIIIYIYILHLFQFPEA